MCRSSEADVGEGEGSIEVWLKLAAALPAEALPQVDVKEVQLPPARDKQVVKLFRLLFGDVLCRRGPEPSIEVCLLDLCTVNHGSQVHKPLAVLKDMDTNADGRLTLAEMRAGMAVLAASLSDTEFTNIMQEMTEAAGNSPVPLAGAPVPLEAATTTPPHRAGAAGSEPESAPVPVLLPPPAPPVQEQRPVTRQASMDARLQAAAAVRDGHAQDVQREWVNQLARTADEMTEETREERVWLKRGSSITYRETVLELAPGELRVKGERMEVTQVTPLEKSASLVMQTAAGTMRVRFDTRDAMQSWCAALSNAQG